MRNPTYGGWPTGKSQCIECGDELPRFSRPDRLFCGDTCRKRHSRRGQRVDAVLADTMLSLQEVRRYLKKPVKDRKHVDQVNAQLKRLRDEIQDILRLRDRETITEMAQRDELIAGMRKGE